MIKYAALFMFLAAVANAEPLRDRKEVQMDAESLEIFNQYFRQALLGIITNEMKDAIDKSTILSELNEKCQNDMLLQAEQCNSCIQDGCSISNIFEEFIEVLDPTISIVTMLEDVTNKLADAVELLGVNANVFLNDIREFAAYASGAELEAIWMAVEELKEKIEEVANNIASPVNNAIDSAGEIRNDVAGSQDSGDYYENSLDRLRDKLGNGFYGFDKRKKRYIDGQTRQCMEGCDVCYPLLIETNTERITSVCGVVIIEQNQTLTSLTRKIMNVYGAVVDDRDNPMVSEIRYEMLSKNSRMQQTNVVITVRLYGGETITYEKEVRSRMPNVPNTAREMAMDYWMRTN